MTPSNNEMIAQYGSNKFFITSFLVLCEEYHYRRNGPSHLSHPPPNQTFHEQ